MLCWPSGALTPLFTGFLASNPWRALYIKHKFQLGNKNFPSCTGLQAPRGRLSLTWKEGAPAQSPRTRWLRALPTGAWLISPWVDARSEEHTSELQSRGQLVCRLQLEKKNTELQE